METKKRKKQKGMPESGLHVPVSKCSGGYDVPVLTTRGRYVRGDTFRLAARKDGTGAKGFLAAKTYDTGADKFPGDRLFDRSFRTAESNYRRTYAVGGD